MIAKKKKSENWSSFYFNRSKRIIQVRKNIAYTFREGLPYLSNFYSLVMNNADTDACVLHNL